MAKTPEGAVKKQATKILDEFGAYYFFPVTGGYGRSGLADIVACVGGYFVAIECKSASGKTTALQERELARIKAEGGQAVVFRGTDDDCRELRHMLKLMTS